jgi:hypothetical protein
MKLEKAKKVTKLKKSQLQNQKQVQNVVVNLPQAPRKRKPKALQAPSKQGPNKSHFQSPIYMPPVVSYNPKQDNNFLLTEIMKHIKGSTTQPLNNQIEKPKPSDEQTALDRITQTQPPSLPQAFNTSAPPNRSLSLVGEMTGEASNDQRTFIKPSQFEAKQEPFQFKAPPMAEPKSTPSLIQSLTIGQEQKFRPETDQQWSELETGGHFGLLGINSQQLKDHKEAKRAFTFEALSLPTLTEEPRPTSEEIDLGIVPQEAGLIVQEDRVESNEPPINLEPLSMGAGQSFTREFIPEFTEFDESGEIRGVSDADAVVAKDNQEFFDFMKTIDISTGASTRSRQGAELLTPEKEPSLAEKLNMPVATSRFASPEAPEALAELLVNQARSKKVNSNTDSRLQAADFRNKPELIKAIEVWNKSHPDQKMTYLRPNKSQLTLDELEIEATANDITFDDIKQNIKRKVKVKGSTI